MKRNSHRRVLAIDPTTRGFGFVVFEGAQRLIDWGVAQVRTDKLNGCLERIEELLLRYQPSVLVLEDPEGSRRCARVRQLLAKTREFALERSVTARSYSRRKVRRAFAYASAGTKQEIATLIVQRFPELSSRLPAPRKPWMTEAESMSVFDSVSLALTFYYRKQGRSAVAQGQHLYNKERAEQVTPKTEEPPVERPEVEEDIPF